MTKLLGYDFQVEYKKGRENKVTDALTRKEEDTHEVILNVISILVANWLVDLKASYVGDDQAQELIDKAKKGEMDPVTYNWRDGVLFYQGRLYIGASNTLHGQIIHHAHSSPMGGHSGFSKTLHRAKRDFFLPGLKK